MEIEISNSRTFLRFAKNPNADEALQYADFIKGNDKFEGQGKDLGRGRLDTVRAKFNHVASMTTDGNYLYLATVPNNKDAKTFVISKVSLKDRVLSGEFTPNLSVEITKATNATSKTPILPKFITVLLDASLLKILL